MTGGPIRGAGNPARVCERPAVPLERPADIPDYGPEQRTLCPLLTPAGPASLIGAGAGSESSS